VACASGAAAGLFRHVDRCRSHFSNIAVSAQTAQQTRQKVAMANKATVRNAYGVPAMFVGSKTGSDDAAFVFVRVGNEERRMRWAEWDALPAWTGPRPSWGPKFGAQTPILDQT
jgi:hypothetical protein